MSTLSNLFGNGRSFDLDLYLTTLATSFGFARENVQLWNENLTVSSPTAIRVYEPSNGSGGITYYAPKAAPNNPIIMGASPEDDLNWQIFTIAGAFTGKAAYASHIATANNQTHFTVPTGGSILPENNEVYKDSIRLIPYADYLINVDAASSRTDIVLNVGVIVNTKVDIFSFFTLNDGEYSYAVPVQKDYIGDGVTVSFELIAPNLSATGIFVVLDGLLLTANKDYSYGGNNVDFTKAPDVGAVIDMKAFAPFIVGTPPPDTALAPIIDAHVGDGIKKDFLVQSKPSGTSSTMLVHVQGLLRAISQYSYDQDTGILSFTEAPLVGDAIDIIMFAVTVIDISNSYSKATNSTQERTISDRFSDIVNVLDFGAIADGIADDTDAFTAAFEAAPEGAGVYIPVSTGGYFISADFEGKVSFAFGVVKTSGTGKLGTTHKNLLG